ncbi:MAG: hypothetical protein ABR608_02200 [Pseudonocardiaceae bacterium]
MGRSRTPGRGTIEHVEWRLLGATGEECAAVAAHDVATLLRGPTLLPTVNQAEVIDQLVRT